MLKNVQLFSETYCLRKLLFLREVLQEVSYFLFSKSNGWESDKTDNHLFKFRAETPELLEKLDLHIKTCLVCQVIFWSQKLKTLIFVIHS